MRGDALIVAVSLILLILLYEPSQYSSKMVKRGKDFQKIYNVAFPTMHFISNWELITMLLQQLLYTIIHPQIWTTLSCGFDIVYTMSGYEGVCMILWSESLQLEKSINLDYQNLSTSVRLEWIVSLEMMWLQDALFVLLYAPKVVSHRFISLPTDPNVDKI